MTTRDQVAAGLVRTGISETEIDPVREMALSNAYSSAAARFLAMAALAGVAPFGQERSS